MEGGGAGGGRGFPFAPLYQRVLQPTLPFPYLPRPAAPGGLSVPILHVNEARGQHLPESHLHCTDLVNPGLTWSLLFDCNTSLGQDCAPPTPHLPPPSPQNPRLLPTCVMEGWPVLLGLDVLMEGPSTETPCLLGFQTRNWGWWEPASSQPSSGPYWVMW